MHRALSCSPEATTSLKYPTSLLVSQGACSIDFTGSRLKATEIGNLRLCQWNTPWKSLKKLWTMIGSIKVEQLTWDESAILHHKDSRSDFGDVPSSTRVCSAKASSSSACYWLTLINKHISSSKTGKSACNCRSKDPVDCISMTSYPSITSCVLQRNQANLLLRALNSQQRKMGHAKRPMGSAHHDINVHPVSSSLHDILDLRANTEVEVFLDSRWKTVVLEVPSIREWVWMLNSWL